VATTVVRDALPITAADGRRRPPVHHPQLTAASRGITVPDDVDRNARIRTAERGTSVSALVGEFPRSLSSREAAFSRLEAQQQQAQREIQRLRARDRLGRDQLHHRAVSRLRGCVAGGQLCEQLPSGVAMCYN
jgi:hypothetical protein